LLSNLWPTKQILISLARLQNFYHECRTTCNQQGFRC